MSSPNIDKWIEKNPESWATLAENTNNKETFNSFKKKFLKGANKNGKGKAVKQMTNEQLKTIYNASGLATTKQKTTTKTTQVKAYKPRLITIKRKGKTYNKTLNGRWNKQSNLGLKIASQLKPRSKEYNIYVKNIVTSTGRTRQAVVKKIQRTRR